MGSGGYVYDDDAAAVDAFWNEQVRRGRGYGGSAYRSTATSPARGGSQRHAGATGRPSSSSYAYSQGQRRAKVDYHRAAAVASVKSERAVPDPEQPPVEIEEVDDDLLGETKAEYEAYAPTHGASIPGGPHPDPVVETGTLAKVTPPVPAYEHSLRDIVENGGLSSLQMESVVYACMRHEMRLPGEKQARAGFFLGDGAGVGKGRQIAALVYEHRRRGGKRVLWVSTSADLKYDAMRDLNDLNATPSIIVEPRSQSGLPSGPLSEIVDKGVVFCTYSLLIRGAPRTTKKMKQSTDASEKMVVEGSRLKQLVDWLEEDEHGALIIFDECHKAKNLFSAAGKPTKTAVCVVALQEVLPNARVLYASATGASEPKNLGYMTRLGHFGWKDTVEMIKHLEPKNSGLGALEIFACGLKATGSYLCRTLSYANAEFELVDCKLSHEMELMYDRSTALWLIFKKAFDACVRLQDADNPNDAVDLINLKDGMDGMLVRLFWATHQRFYRQMLMAAKVPTLAKMARRAVEQENMAVVIGLQSTGEASLTRAVDGGLGDDNDFVSAPAEMLSRFVMDYFPTKSSPQSAQMTTIWDSVLADVVRVVNTWCSQETIADAVGRAAVRRVMDEQRNAPEPPANATERRVPSGDTAMTVNTTAAPSKDESDSDIEVAVEKSLDDVLAERREAAKAEGNFLDLTNDNIAQRVRAGVNESQVKELELMEQRVATGLNTLLHSVGEQTLVDAAQAAATTTTTTEPNGSARKRPSQTPSSTPAPARRRIDADIIELDMSETDEESEEDFRKSTIKRRASYELARSTFDGVPGPSTAAVVKREVGVAATPTSTARPAANVLARLGRFMPEVADASRELETQLNNVDDQEPAPAPPTVQAAPRAPANVPQRRVKREPVQEDSDDESDEDNSDTDGSDGGRVTNPHMVAIRSLLVRAVEHLQLPPNPLDNLIDLCGGHTAVAEMTGRKMHQVRRSDGVVVTRQRTEDGDASGKMLNISEKRKFQNGEKLIAIISDAASTGISLQADRRVANQRRRCHMTLELPWSADKAIQQFGRSHRANQSSAPLYRIFMTPCGGERRFASSAAKRLLSLGALLKGDRNAMGAGQSLQGFDIDNTYGAQAMRKMMMDLKGASLPLQNVTIDGHLFGSTERLIEMIQNDFVGVGLGERDSRGRFHLKAKNEVPVAKFLNRLLGLPIQSQRVAFEYFMETLKALIKELKQNGTYDDGVFNITGTSITASEENCHVIHTCSLSQAETSLRLVESDQGVSYRHVCALKHEYNRNKAEMFENSRQKGRCGFYIATYGTAARTNRPYVCYAQEVKKFGREVTNYDVRNPQMRIYRPNDFDSKLMTLDNLEANYQLVEDHDVIFAIRFRELWNFWYEFSSKTCRHGKGCKATTFGGRCQDGVRFKDDVLICGAVLPIWKVLNERFKRAVGQRDSGTVYRHIKVARVQTSTGEKLVGLKVSDKDAKNDYQGFVERTKQTIEDYEKGGIDPRTAEDRELDYADEY